MQSSDPAYYIWQVPGRPVAVHLRRQVMEWIDDQVRSAFQSIPRRGAEAGGLLVGSKTIKEGHPIIMVESAEAIECEHRNGPSFLLSETDRAKLTDQMKRLRAEGLVVVGCFRSHLRDELPVGELTLNRDDEEMLETWSPGAASVFLLLRPFSIARVLGNLFFWHEGRVSRDSEFVPFPFGGLAPTRGVSPSARHQSSPVRQMPSPPPLPSRRLNIPWVWLVIFALLGGATGYKVISTYANAQTRTRIEQIVPFDLAADRVQDKVVLRWDPAGPGLRDAQKAGLVIRDGSEITRINLDRAQLLEGALTYQPKAGDVMFSLETHSASGPDGRGVLTFIEPRR